jgi:RNA polymerase sigma-70 factor (ECF subfamily)
MRVREDRLRALAEDRSDRPDPGFELDDLLADLDPDRRTSFVLTQLLGYSYAEAAEVCECPVGTIRSRVARARAELAEAWADELPTGTPEAVDR